MPKKTRIEKKPAKKKAIPQFYPVQVIVSIPRAGEFIANVKVDLWGLVLGDEPTYHAQDELESVVYRSLKVKPMKGELEKLLAAHKQFHNKE